MALMPTLARPAQWASLRALVDLVDPHLLVQAGDPLFIGRMLEALPEQFRIEAQRLLDRRRQDVDKKAEQDSER
jgi:hypothetical protein